MLSPKPKRCAIKECRTEFIPFRMQSVCSPGCAQKAAEAKRLKERAKREQEERATIRKRKQALKTRRDYINEAQVAFNAFIRERDRDEPCICCGAALGSWSVGGNYDCGHYRSVGSAPHLRFDPRNANAQQKQCNRYGAGRAIDYRIGLVRRIGLEAVEALEADNAPAKWSIEELIAIKVKYRTLAKALRGGKRMSKDKTSDWMLSTAHELVGNPPKEQLSCVRCQGDLSKPCIPHWVGKSAGWKESADLRHMTNFITF